MATVAGIEPADIPLWRRSQHHCLTANETGVIDEARTRYQQIHNLPAHPFAFDHRNFTNDWRGVWESNPRKLGRQPSAPAAMRTPRKFAVLRHCQSAISSSPNDHRHTSSVWLRAHESNVPSSAYETDDRPLAQPATPCEKTSQPLIGSQIRVGEGL